MAAAAGIGAVAREPGIVEEPAPELHFLFRDGIVCRNKWRGKPARKTAGEKRGIRGPGLGWRRLQADNERREQKGDGEEKASGSPFLRQHGNGLPDASFYLQLA